MAWIGCCEREGCSVVVTNIPWHAARHKSYCMVHLSGDLENVGVDVGKGVLHPTAVGWKTVAIGPWTSLGLGFGSVGRGAAELIQQYFMPRRE